MRSFFLAISLVMLSGIAPAQQKKRGTLEDVGKTLDSAGGAFRDIFKGKKDKSNNNEQSGKAPGNTTENNTGNIKKGNGLAGSIHPNAIYVDADKFGPFAGGAAVIQKANLTALINSRGESIFPYSSPLEIGRLEMDQVQPGFFYAYDRPNNKNYLINASGRKLIELWTKNLKVVDYNYRSGAFLFLVPNTSTPAKEEILIIDTSGKTYPITSNQIKASNFYFVNDRWKAVIGDGLIALPEEQGKNNILFGYKNLQNNWVIPPAFDEALPFSDGMAVVGKKNEFGEIKYGFIDRTGKLVIPYKFSKLPGDFQYGVAGIEPKSGNTEGISYAFINKKGEVLFDATNDRIRAGERPRVHFSSLERRGFTYGLVFGPRAIMDTTGKTIPPAEFSSRLGLPASTSFYSWGLTSFLSLHDDKRIPVLYYQGRNREFQKNTTGFIWMDTQKVIDAVFEKVGYFDPKSRLAYAKMQIGKDASKLSSFREGYINEDGVFVILKKAQSEW